jgi:hypothetical protein
VAADPNLVNAQTWLNLKKLLAESISSNLVSSKNLIDQIWTEGTGRPPFVVRYTKITYN